MEPEFFSGVTTPALNEYASRRPSCLLESIERLYQSSNIFYTGPQSHYTQRKLGPKVPEWLRKTHGKSKPKGDIDEETSTEGKERHKSKALQSLAKEFGRAVRQQDQWEMGMGNGELGTGNGESLKAGIFKMVNLKNRESLKAGIFCKRFHNRG